MKRLFVEIGIVVCVGALAPAEALAQTAGSDLSAASTAAPDIFARDRDVSVRERPRPEYDPIGVRLGQFLILPKIEMDAVYDDNIYATNAHKVSDEIAVAKPDITAQSDWVRHSLSAHLDAERDQYARSSSESTTDWDAGAAGRLDITRDSNFSLGASAAHQTEARETSGTPSDASQPVQYDYDQVNAVYLQTFNRLRATLRIDERDFSYWNVASFGGGTINETFRNHTEGYYTIRADYAESPSIAFYLQAQFNSRNYSQAGTLAAPDRTSKGYELLGGANFELTNVIRGEVGAGYLEQSYSAAAFSNQGGIGVRAKIDWFVSPLTTVNAVISRGIEDPGVPNSAGGIVTNSVITLDHELLRNLILTGTIGYAVETYNGIQRTDDRWRSGVGATWLLNGAVGVDLAYDRYTQNSSGAGAGPNFDDNRVTLGLILHY